VSQLLFFTLTLSKFKVLPVSAIQLYFMHTCSVRKGVFKMEKWSKDRYRKTPSSLVMSGGATCGLWPVACGLWFDLWLE